MLAFDEASHVYTWEGRAVVNVTRVLDSTLDTYAAIPKDVLERARQEGLAIHRAIELHLAGKLAHCPEWLDPYILAWETFARDVGFQLEASERRLYHAQHDFAGTADLFGWMRLRKTKRHVCIDLKRSFAGGAAIGLQTAAYAGAYNQFLGPGDGAKRIEARFALRLVPGSSPPYQLKEFTEVGDFGVFLSFLQVYRWKLKEKPL